MRQRHHQCHDLVFGIGYDDSTEKAQTVLEEVVAQHPLVLDQPEPVIRVHELGQSSVNFVCRPWVNGADYWTVYWDLTRQVEERFDEAGITIPYPQQAVHHVYPTGPAPAKDISSPTRQSQTMQDFARQGEGYDQRTGD